MKWLSLLLPIALASLNPASAILDIDGSCMSDLWEDQFDLQAADRIEEADPDGDGWTNLQESVAGTDPLSGEPGAGFLQTSIVRNPSVAGVFVVSWPGSVGKDYTLSVSADLQAESWTQVGDFILGDGNEIEIAIDLSGGAIPEKLFWRVAVQDADGDFDGLTDSEEDALGTDPLLWDSDGDLMDDKWETVYGLDPLDDGQILAVNGAVGDLDGDELSNFWEHYFGTKPTVADTDGDGVSDFEEVTSLDSDPNSNDSDGDSVPDNHDIFLVGRTVTVNRPKLGFRDFDPNSDPPAYYMVETTSWTDIQGTTGEAGVINGVGPGTKTRTVNRTTGEISENLSGVGSQSLGGGTMESPTVKSGTNTVRTYDDPPNEEPDEPGTVEVTATLSSEYTTAMLKEDVVAAMPPFSSTWANSTSTAHQLLAEDESRLDLRNLEYKFKMGPDAGHVDLRWLVTFTPWNDPGTSENESNSPKASIFTWSGDAAESPVYSIEPAEIDPNGYGAYNVSPVEIKADQTDTPDPDDVPATYKNAPRRGSATNLLSVWPDEPITLRVETYGALGSTSNWPANFTVWTAPDHTIPNNSPDATLSWPPLTVDPLKLIKIRVAGQEFRTHIKVQHVGMMSRVEATAYAPHAAAAMALYRQAAKDYGDSFAPDRSKVDAMRHACWCAMAVSVTGVTVGDVQMLSTAHEYDDKNLEKNRAFESTMDLNNNAVGMLANHSSNGLPDTAAIQADLATRYAAGEMYIWERPPGSPAYDSDGVLIKSDKTRIYP